MNVAAKPQTSIYLDGAPARLGLVLKDRAALTYWYALKLDGHGWQIFDVRGLGVNAAEWLERVSSNEAAILADVALLLEGRTAAEMAAHLVPL